jgi:aminopeptidase N
MSTYLVAFIVSDFVSIDGQTDKGTIVRVWAPIDKISQASVALDAVPTSLLPASPVAYSYLM